MDRPTSKAEALQDVARKEGGAVERLSKRVYETILTDIVRGIYVEGDRLPTETTFAEQFGVSRADAEGHDGADCAKQG